MKKTIPLIIAAGSIALLAVLAKREWIDPRQDRNKIKEATLQDEIRNGDLIFHTSRSDQSLAIQRATGSAYSHCGVIYKEAGQFYVFEAVQPVSRTPLEKWIQRGENGKYVIKRLKDADQVLTASTLGKMKQVGEQFIGKNYDGVFGWSDDRIYCSELIWKIYNRGAGIEIGRLEN